MASAPEDDRPVKKPRYEPGQDLALFSVDEIGAAIELLREEIARLEAARESKLASRNAAAAFFKQ